MPPEFVEDWKSTKFEVEEGTTVTLVCNATGVPMPVVTWYKQSKLLKDYNEAENGSKKSYLSFDKYIIYIVHHDDI